MKKLFLLIILLFSMTSFAKEVFCRDNLDAYNDCVDSFFFNEESDRCKKKLITDYSGGLSWPLNMHLRGIETDPSCEPILSKLYEAVANLNISKERTFYRGVYHFPVLDQLSVGDCLIDKAYFSTSLIEEKAKNFTNRSSKNNKDQILFEVSSSNGRERLDLGGYTHEAEIIFLPNTPMKLLKIDKNLKWGRAKIRFYFEEVTKNECKEIYH